MTTGNVGFIFPGQGSQKIGMLAEIANDNAVVLETYSEASAALGYDLWALSQTGEAEAINQTEVTQPLLLTASTALWRLWVARDGARPSILAGHSLGEWSALVCAGVLDFADAVRMVRNRGKYMQSAVPPGKGSMAAIIGLDDDAVRGACEQSSDAGVVVPVNFNSVGQVVIAGETEAVDRAVAACKEAGARRAALLPVSAPFHTELMRPAAELLAEDLAAVSFHSPQIPILHNVTVAEQSDPALIRNQMIEQITAPVPWVATVETLKKRGVNQLVECGPGKVLGGLIKRIDKEIVTQSIDTPESFNASFQDGSGRA